LPQLQGVQGRRCSRLPLALGNAEDGMASAFPKGKQNENIFLERQLIDTRQINFEKHNKNGNYFKILPLFFIWFTIN
jgi:hypothetical protein